MNNNELNNYCYKCNKFIHNNDSIVKREASYTKRYGLFFMNCKTENSKFISCAEC